MGRHLIPRWQWLLIGVAILAMVAVVVASSPKSWMYAMVSGQCSAAKPPSVCYTRGRHGGWRNPHD
ncbi:MAG TPA: hypothetical protein VGG10_06885 [Rhizomicrobium sp.]